MNTKTINGMKAWINTLAFTLIAVVVVRVFIVDIYTVPTASMQPTLQPNDVVLVNKAAYGGWVFNEHLSGYTSPNSGDMVAFFMPAEGKVNTDQKTKFVKRCVGIPHDKVVSRGRLWAVTHDTLSAGFDIPAAGDVITLTANNIAFYKPLIEQYEHQKAGIVGQTIFVNSKMTDTYTFRQNYYFVTGDNAAQSHDSRYWGLLPEDHLIGKIVYIFGR